MRCDVHAYLSQHLYDLSEENVWNQAFDLARHEGVTDVFLMPDCHVGSGVPIGSVAITEDVIIQSIPSYDISCGVICMKVPGLYSQDVASWDKRERWVREIERRIGFGKGEGNKSDSNIDIQEIFRTGAKSLGISSESCERQYIPVESEIDTTIIYKAFEKALPQLGSVGGGNHHLELQVDEKDGSVWVTTHCGSRGYGWQTANHFFYEGARLRDIPSSQRERSWLRIDEPLGKEYWAYHNTAANYAIANRHIIVNHINDALQKIFKVTGEVYYEISHNLVQQETLVLPDGTTKKGFVHRKGATRAFPAGHPDLVGTHWEKTGHPIIVPGSMFDGAAILSPQPGAYNTACSVNHGSGRVMARGEAKRKLSHKQEFIDDRMKNVKRKLGGHEIRGVVGNYKKTPIDECTHVYKDLDEVLAVLEAENIAKIEHRLFPVANLKGSD